MNVAPGGFPKIWTPMVDSEGNLQRVWYQFLRTLWMRTGATLNTAVNGALDAFGVASVTLGNSAPIALVSGTEGANGVLTQTTKLAGTAAVLQVLGASPFVFTATVQGTLLVYGGEVEFSRDAGVTWFMLGLVGGAIPVMTNDRVRVSWFSPAAPPVTFMPGAVA